MSSESTIDVERATSSLDKPWSWTLKHPWEVRNAAGEFLARFSNGACAARTVAWLGRGYYVAVEGVLTADWRQCCRGIIK